MRAQSEINDFLVRLRFLQNADCDGKIGRDSLEHFEILALEKLESLFVKQEMDKSHAAELGMLDRRTRQVKTAAGNAHRELKPVTAARISPSWLDSGMAFRLSVGG